MGHQRGTTTQRSAVVMEINSFNLTLLLPDDGRGIGPWPARHSPAAA